MTDKAKLFQLSLHTWQFEFRYVADEFEADEIREEDWVGIREDMMDGLQTLIVNHYQVPAQAVSDYYEARGDEAIWAAADVHQLKALLDSKFTV